VCDPGPVCVQVANIGSQSSSALVQGSISTSQFVEFQPVKQLQKYASTPSTQVAPFWHGDDVQASMLFPQLVPL
jgi:hypothetical protein